MSKITRSLPSPPDGPNLFFSVSEVASRWKVSERHIRRLIADGRLSVTRIGRAVRISAEAVALREAAAG